MRRYLWDDEVISREKAEETLRAGIESFDRGGFGLWSVFPVTGGALLGFCGLRRFGDESEVEVLFGIRPDVWGRGLATEAATAVLTRAFREDGLAKVYAGADASNPASFRVMEKLGMRFAEIRSTPAGETPYWVIEREEFLLRRAVSRSRQY